MPYCANCGTQVTPEMFYCPQCGRRLTVSAAGLKEDKSAVAIKPAMSPEVGKQETTARNEIRKGKLFKEWVKYSGLSIPEGSQQKEAQVAKGKSHLFYVLIGVGIAACVGLLILLVKTW